MLDGLAEDETKDMRKRAWAVSHLMVAAGCKPEQVTIDRLLGEKQKTRRLPDPDAKVRRDIAKMYAKAEKLRAANG
jgi:hypothetical protein